MVPRNEMFESTSFVLDVRDEIDRKPAKSSVGNFEVDGFDARVHAIPFRWEEHPVVDDDGGEDGSCVPKGEVEFLVAVEEAIRNQRG